MTDLLNEMMQDSDIIDKEAATNATSSLDQVATIAFEQVQLEDEIEAIEELLKTKSEALRLIKEVKLPQAMQSCGINKFTTTAGFAITVKPYYSALIKGENEAECFEWLKEHGHDDIIKNEIKTTFGRGEDAVAAKVIETLAAMHIPCAAKKSVHPQTLSAFVREQVESGNPDFPLDTFHVYIGQKATIKRSK